MTLRNEILCTREGLVFRKGGGAVGLIESIFGKCWYWRTATMEHIGTERTKKEAIAALIAAWDLEGAEQ